MCIKLSIEHFATWDSRTNLNYIIEYKFTIVILFAFYLHNYTKWLHISLQTKLHFSYKHKRFDI